MPGKICSRLWVLLVVGAISIPSAAEEAEIDGRFELAWWSNNFSADALDASFDAGTVGAEGELWWRRGWGLKASLFKSDVVDSNSRDGPDFFYIDLKRRLISPTRNNFLALGLGWENIDLATGADTEGPRLLLQGGLGLTPVLSLYGHTAWLPVLDPSERLDDPKGFEFEAGIAVKPFPFLSFRVGYKHFRLDFRSLEGVNETSKSKGVILGAGVNF